MKKCAATLMLMALPATAALSDSWVCEFPTREIDGWIRGQVFITISGDEATAYDSLINQEHGGPIPATIATSNDKRVTLRWDLKRVELRHGYAPRIRYTLTYVRGTGAATFTAQAPELQDYRNSSRAGGNFSARGDCALK